MTISNSYGLYIKQPTIGNNRVGAFFGGYVGLNMLAPQYWRQLILLLMVYY